MLKEAYGKESPVSSKDEDWSEESTAKKSKKDDNKREDAKLPGAKAQSANNRRSLGIKGKVEDDNGIDLPNLDQPQVSKTTSESTPDKGHENLVEQCDGDQLLGLDGNTVTSSARKYFGQETSQVSLYEFSMLNIERQSLIYIATSIVPFWTILVAND